jgi:hypothetical protein
VGSPPRDQSSPRKGPPPRRVDPSRKMRGRQGRRDKREREGPPDGREAVLAEHSSDGSKVFHANAHENTSGHRQPGKTCAREAARPGSQGTNAVRGTWCSAGDAGRPLRTKAGQGQGTPSPRPIPLRQERIATEASCRRAGGDGGRGWSESSGHLAVWKRAAPRNRMRESLTYGSVGGPVGQPPALPGQPTAYSVRCAPAASGG